MCKKCKKTKSHVASELALTDRSINQTDPAGTDDQWKGAPNAKFSAGDGANSNN